MTFFHYVLVLALICSVLFSRPVESAPSCDSSTYEAPENCAHGIKTDYCNRPVCAKGVGESCGGTWLQHGICGEGMFCSCNICMGCDTITMKCYTGESIC